LKVAKRMTRFLIEILPLFFLFNGCPVAINAALQVTNIITFDCTNGSSPAVIYPIQGGFYGSTQDGGADTNGNCLYGAGTIYTFDFSGQLTTRVTFVPDAFSPNALMAKQNDGTILGTTLRGGTDNRGTVFKLTTNNQLIVVADFGSSPGYEPMDGLTIGADGNFYGTTRFGGGGPYSGGGTIFKVVSNSTIITLHQFQLVDGFGPALSISDQNGNLFGVTDQGGFTNSNFPLGLGTVFQITTNGTFTNLVKFNGTNGCFPYVGLASDHDGAIYGCTPYGGSEFDGVSLGKGTLFRISPEKVFSTLHNFSGGTNGERPYTLMTIGRDEKLYGATQSGGAFGFGTLFSITKDGSFQTLCSFNTNRPVLSVTFGSDGCLYAVQGPSFPGGSSGWGWIARFSIPMTPTIRSVKKNGNTINLTWDSVAGQSYQLQCASSVAATNWTTLGSTVLATNGLISVSDTSPPPDQRFYRVALVP
jgi:uncharacterized repeat protein (TIGR03803 family)